MVKSGKRKRERDRRRRRRDYSPVTAPPAPASKKRRTAKWKGCADHEESSRRSPSKGNPAGGGSRAEDRSPPPSSSPALLPPPFPPGLRVPAGEFLRDEEPYRDSFRAAIDTCYEGFAVDEERSAGGQSPSSPFDHGRIRRALAALDSRGFFRTDVTQPFGLGTRCARTYVTRCLLGDWGTTYKYLGLRMFSHPWGGADGATGAILDLNRRLAERTREHLRDLGERRGTRLGGAPHINGRARYNVALINRMTNEPGGLKPEPTVKRDRSAVSWHADSSLEHHSSIAVYQVIVVDDGEGGGRATGDEFRRENELAANWSVALRVAHDSEGPRAPRRGTGIDAAVVADAPPVSVSLPSRSAYYLLDDFNHHHQHAVLLRNDGDPRRCGAGGLRYASTHRLLREGHNVVFVLERCRAACSQFHRRGPKIWRSEQLLLSDIESEWIRQFYIQGEGHKAKLWNYWEEPMCQLLKYWGQLESRTKQVTDLLKFAAIARCGKGDGKKSHRGDRTPSKTERKTREKQKKALNTMEDLIKRGPMSSDATGGVSSVFYEPICDLLEARAKMRSLWLERERDGVFHSMPADYSPLPVPLHFGVTDPTRNASQAGASPLGGTAEDLIRLGNDLKNFGRAFMSQKVSDLPKMVDSSAKQRTEKRSGGDAPSKAPSLLPSPQKTKLHIVEHQSNNVKDESELKKGAMMGEANSGEQLAEPPIMTSADHRKGPNWSAWNSIIVGLEMQEPWADLLLNGTKTVETRAYSIPKDLIGKKIDLLESKPGEDGFSSIPNVVAGEKCKTSFKQVGWCIFDRVIEYKDKAQFEADRSKHLVEPASNYGWQDDTKVVYGWVVSKCRRYRNRSKRRKKRQKKTKCAIRRMRSLFEIQT